MKKKIRQIIKNKRLLLSQEEIKHYSINAFKKIIELEEWDKSKCIMSYLSFKGELDPDFINKEALLEGKTLLLPKINSDTKNMKAIKIENLEQTKLNDYGIEEPTGNLELNPDLVILPSIALDREGNRIGHGGGFYDRYLEKRKVKKIGIIYDFQLLEQIEKNPHDIPVDIIISVSKTDAEVIFIN